jgi:hypothetical protein
MSISTNKIHEMTKLFFEDTYKSEDLSHWHEYAITFFYTSNLLLRYNYGTNIVSKSYR